MYFTYFMSNWAQEKKINSRPNKINQRKKKRTKQPLGNKEQKKKKDERKVSDKGSVHQEMWYSEEDSHVVLSITRIVPITGQQNCQASVHRGKFIKKEW